MLFIFFFLNEDFKDVSISIYGISTDSHFCHKAWYDSSEAIGKIQYPLISDTTFSISRSFEVLREEEGRAERGTFVIDPDGVIKVMEITCEGVGRDAEGLLQKVKAAQYVRDNPDEVCPAKWKEGEATLAPSLPVSATSRSTRRSSRRKASVMTSPLW